MGIFAAKVLNQAGEKLGGFLPRLAGALVLLVLGLLFARVAAALIGRALRAAGMDTLAERWGIPPVLARIGLGRSLSDLVRLALRVGVSVVVVFAALSLLGLQFLSDSLNKAVLFFPSLLAALALLLAGGVLGVLARERVDRLTRQMDFPLPLGQLAQLTVFAIFGLMAAAQLALSTAVLVILLGILVTAATVTFTLAFGLGGREVARALSSARYVRGSYSIGQTISLGEYRGAIVEIDSTATVLETGGGRRVRVPNHLLIESVVTLHDAEPPSA